jgi:hypothetical protein
MISSGRAKVSRLGVTIAATPRGSSTRAISATARSGSGTCSIDWTATTEEKLASENGNARMSATTVWRCWLARAAGSMSTATDSRGASSAAEWPVPAPTSSTRPPRGRTSATRP